MAIEIRELVIKTTIVEAPAARDERAPELGRAARAQILAECRRLVAELLRERGER